MAFSVASFGGALIDFFTQVVSQYVENKEVNLSEIDPVRIIKTGVLTGLGTAIPSLKHAGNVVDGIGTALIWGEGATLISCIDVIFSNLTSTEESSNREETSINQQNVPMYEKSLQNTGGGLCTTK